VVDYESLDDHQLIHWVSQVDKDALEALPGTKRPCIPLPRSCWNNQPWPKKSL